MTEFSSYWCEHPAIFAAPAKETDPKKRALLVLKWFLTTLKQQYASRSEQYGNEKKPLNPFLGEIFLGTWEDEAGTTELISEQVRYEKDNDMTLVVFCPCLLSSSHHPPATAYSITNKPTGVHLEGYNAQKATFSRTINIKQIGHAVLTVPNPSAGGESDKYLITLPALHIEGLIFGSPFIELEGATYITSSTGYTAKIDYAGKGWISGKKNSFTASLYPTGKEKDVLYNVAGQWTKTFDIHSGSAKQCSKSTFIETYDPAQNPASKLIVAPVEQQYPLESRRAWSKVAGAIAKSDLDTVSIEKGKIETAQREMRAKERAEGRIWQRRYFTFNTDAPDRVLTTLGPGVGVPDHGDADKTGGLWRYDAVKAEKAKELHQITPEEAAKVAKELLGQ